jgi:hypothetical protein
MDTAPIVNKVAASDLAVFDLESLWDGNEVVTLDLAPFLFKGLVLKEKDFRASIAELELGDYSGKHVAVDCSTNAIIPTWAYMLVASRLHAVAASVAHGSGDDLVRQQMAARIAAHDWSQYEGRNVIVKGCPSEVIPVSAYVAAVAVLQRVAAKIMYGEACSSVPVWRRPREDRSTGKAVAARLPKTP